MKRRTLLVGTAAFGGLAVAGLALGYRELSSASVPGGAAAGTGPAGQSVLAGWLRIGSDDVVTVWVPHADFGQGVHTALAMMAAEELDADWSRVRTEVAPSDKSFANRFIARDWTLQGRAIPPALDGVVDTAFATVARSMDLQITGGSTAVRMTGASGMRLTGAAAREMLISAAAARWRVAPESLRTEPGAVIDPPSGRRLRYGEIAAEAARLPVPSHPALKTRDQYRLVGTSVERLDIPEKVDGRMIYGIDVRLANLRHAAVLAAPAHGGRLVQVDPAPAARLPGVRQVVPMADAVGVIADRYWSARKALAVLTPEFTGPDGQALDSGALAARQLRRLDEDDAKGPP